MSHRRGQNSAGESSSGNSESNFNALSNNYGYQDREQDYVGMIPSFVMSFLSDDAFNHNPTINADVAGDAGDGSLSESSNHSAENLSNLWHPVDISSGSNASSSGLSGDRREVRDGSRKMFEVGSSSGSQQGYSNPGVGLQRPQEISNAGLMFGIQPNATQRRLLPDLPDLLNQTRPHLAVRSCDNPNHIREPNSVLQQRPTVPMALPITDHAGRQQMALSTPVGIPSTYEAGSSSHQNGPGVAPSSQNGPGSSALNSEVPLSPSPATNGHLTLMDTVLQSGPSVSGPNSNSPGTLISQFGNFLGGLGVANTPETFAVDIGSNDRIFLQLRPSLYNDSQFVAILIQNLMALQQQLENANGGLTEETIRELLTKRNFEGVTGDTRSDAESCCICIDEYVLGEGIGALNCGHEFHPECIKNWLLIRNTCPICKSKGLGA